ncbi:MAG TPA: acyl-CoA dehydrogenase family protein [Thermodesulfobacteriota bacterium]|nr:acyl-CoA dehydrogenase family protein [Thermodesulfobacteriota bacterium]
MTASDYPLLTAKQKYLQAFCTPEEIETAESIRNFVDKEVMPNRHDLEGGWHRDERLALSTLHRLYARCVGLGLTQSNLPTIYGGTGLSPVVRQMINEELSRGDIGLSTMVGKIHWIVSFMLAANRDDLLREFVPRIIEQDSWTACVAITEPQGGANIEDPAFEGHSIRTIAQKDGDSYILKGHKIWPGPAGPAEHFQSENLKGHLGYWTVATTDPSLGEEGIGIFYVPPDAEGLRFSKPYEKMGFSWTDENVEIQFNNVVIPCRYRIDTQPGEGARIVRGYVIGLGRLAGAARLTGLSQAVLEIVLDWTKERKIAETPVRERSMFAGMVAEMFRAIDLSRQYYLSTTWQVTHPEIYGTPWMPQMIARFSAARSFAGDTAEMVTSRAMELMGAYGYAYKYHVEKYMRDFKIVKMWLGGAQRDRLDIAQGLYGPFKWAGMED